MKKILILNWKMQLSVNDSCNLAKKIIDGIDLEEVELGICPDFLSIYKISELIKNSQLKLGSQNTFWATKGAYTGEISPTFLKELGVEFIILGHSERRTNLKETDEIINKKMKTVLENSLTPILCVGENFEERQNNKKDLVIINQIRSALKDVDLKNIKRLIIAYEPIWVIGSGQAIESNEAQETNTIIKQTVSDVLYNCGLELKEKEFENKIQILYGGSVDSNNISKFLKEPNIDGVLVGGAGIKFETLNNLIKSIK
ncbi:MAG: triose-phosphate isomerase [Patescibacteria group bacterium]|nr:triose-phosphate isomerase [Patescibacteria group bacterium]